MSPLTKCHFKTPYVDINQPSFYKQKAHIYHFKTPYVDINQRHYVIVTCSIDISKHHMLILIRERLVTDEAHAKFQNTIC